MAIANPSPPSSPPTTTPPESLPPSTATSSARLNRELGADFHPDRFIHRALWNPAHSRIEMHLESLAPKPSASPPQGTPPATPSPSASSRRNHPHRKQLQIHPRRHLCSTRRRPLHPHPHLHRPRQPLRRHPRHRHLSSPQTQQRRPDLPDRRLLSLELN